MVAYGHGYCKSGYYEGWDEKGKASEEDCKKVCLLDDQCTFASFYESNTCSRYNEASCELPAPDEYTTFIKKGIFLIFGVTFSN